jgi:hypothetical protein
MSREKQTCPCKKLPMCLSSFTAAEYGDLQTLSRLGTSVAGKIDAAGYTPLHLAAQNGHAAATALLLQLGVDVDGKGGCGATPLHRASYSGAVSTMRILLEEKLRCDILAKDTSFGDEMTPLHKAAAGGRYLAVKLLLDAMRSRCNYGGLSTLQQGLEALDSVGRTPLDVAIELCENRKEEQQSVRRWNVVAGGIADWDQCAQLLRSAEIEIRSPRESTSASQSNTKSTLPVLPKHLSEGGSCLDCSASDNGSCLTATWEAAFRSALLSSLPDPGIAMETESRILAQEGTHALAAESMEVQLLHTPSEAGDHDCAPEFGRTCSLCGIQSFALYPSKTGKLVCRSCSKPKKRRIHR